MFGWTSGIRIGSVAWRPMRRVGHCFAPVIFYLNHWVPSDAFFFKRIFSGGATWKILLKTSRNAAGRDAMIFLWWKGKWNFISLDGYILSEKLLILFFWKLNAEGTSNAVFYRGLVAFEKDLFIIVLKAEDIEFGMMRT